MPRITREHKELALTLMTDGYTFLHLNQKLVERGYKPIARATYDAWLLGQEGDEDKDIDTFRTERWGGVFESGLATPEERVRQLSELFYELRPKRLETNVQGSYVVAGLLVKILDEIAKETGGRLKEKVDRGPMTVTIVQDAGNKGKPVEAGKKVRTLPSGNGSQDEDQDTDDD